MAIEIKEDHLGRGGDNAGFADNSDTRSWWIKTDDKTIGKQAIEDFGIGTGAFPTPLLDSHPDNATLLCKRLSIKQQDDKGGMVWRATATYDSKPLSSEQRDKQTEPNPLNRRPVYSVQFERDEKPTDKDIDGELVVNSAKDPFTDPVMVPRTRPRIHGRMNVDPDAIPPWFLDLKDRINEDDYTKFGRVFPAETLLFVPGEIGEPQFENGVEYSVITWDLEYREETWKEKRTDNGFNQIITLMESPGGQKKIPIEIDGERPAEPQLLRDGELIPLDEVEAGEFEELEFDVIETADFSVLP